MEPKTQKTVKLIYNIVFTAVTFVLGGILVFSAASIYFSGGEGGAIYTRSIVSQKLKTALPVALIWALVVIFGIIFKKYLLPKKNKERSPDHMLYSAKKHLLNSDSYDKDILSAIEADKKLNKKLLSVSCVCAAAVLALAVPAAVYFFVPSNFPGIEDINIKVLKAFLFVLPFAVSALAVIYVYGVLSKKYYKKLLENLKNLPKKPKEFKKSPKKTVNILRVVFAFVGVSLVVIGIFNGSMAEVLRKAVRICTECIGLG